ncbi:hypothetical protein EPI10_024157 [Gossypium australe]|uniref:Uncharacterized protein n=1 Tax=Gossypium australe TaxID=47621 RepID=A0A5B6VXR5_9ROSI|nr:hypothetical protein EPI10_024157 [Gossypium australe]
MPSPIVEIAKDSQCIPCIHDLEELVEILAREMKELRNKHVPLCRRSDLKTVRNNEIPVSPPLSR